MDAAQTSNFGYALYYSHIEIQDINWLKLALLYWDGLRRIVPDSISPNDNSDVREVTNAGFLKNTSPVLYSQNATQKFLSAFTHIIKGMDKDSLIEKQNFSNESDALRFLDLVLSHKSDNLNDMFTPSSLYPDSDSFKIDKLSQFHNPNSIFLNSDVLKKSVPVFEMHPGGYGISRVHFELLESHNLAKDLGDGWFKTNQIIGGLFLMCIASEMSEKIGTPLVTNASQFEAYGEYLSFGKPTSSQTEYLPGVLLKLGIEFPHAEALTELSILEILKFREQRKDERKRFRDVIELITVKANTITDPNQLEDFFSSKGEEIKSAIQDHRKVLDELNVKTFSSLLSVSAPTAIATTAGLAVPPVAMALTGMGIGISLVNWWAEVRKERREKTQASPWHYLLSMKQLT